MELTVRKQRAILKISSRTGGRMMKIEIREMREADIGDVQHVATASWHTTYEGIITQSIQDRCRDAAYSEQRMRIRSKQSCILVAEVGGEIVGYANYTQV